MQRQGSRGIARTAAGCAAYLLVLAAIAIGLDRWLAPQLQADASPWVAIAAALFLTLGLASLWGLLSGYAGSHSRHDLLAAAASGRVPTSDGPLLASGVVRAIGPALRAPLSDLECVAYRYRMYYLVAVAKGRPSQIPVYWGQACRPFRIDQGGRSIRVSVVPSLIDDEHSHSDEQSIERARRYIARTRFETAAGMVGAIGSAFGTFGDLMGADNSNYRRDWRRSGDVPDPAELILEEVLLPVGGEASVLGYWSASQAALVPGGGGDGTFAASATSGPAERLLDAGNTPLPPSRTAAVLTAAAMLAIGAGIVWGALRFLATTG